VTTRLVEFNVLLDTVAYGSSRKGKSKGKGNVDLYSASSRTPPTRLDMDHTVLPANNTIFAFTRKHSPGGATTHSERLSSTYYSFIDPKRTNG